MASPLGVAVRFRVLSKRRSSALVGLRAPASSSASRAGPCGISSTLPPPTFRSAVILSCDSALLQGLLPEPVPPVARSRARSATASPGVSCPSAPSAWGVHSCRGSRPPATFRLQGFAPSCRFPPPRAFRVCFAPVALVGFTLQGFPLSRSRTAFSAAVALLAFAAADGLPICLAWIGSVGAASPILPDRTARTPAASRALLPSRVRSRRLRDRAKPRPIPSWACASLGFFPAFGSRRRIASALSCFTVLLFRGFPRLGRTSAPQSSSLPRATVLLSEAGCPFEVSCLRWSSSIWKRPGSGLSFRLAPRGCVAAPLTGALEAVTASDRSPTRPPGRHCSGRS